MRGQSLTSLDCFFPWVIHSYEQSKLSKEWGSSKVRFQFAVTKGNSFTCKLKSRKLCCAIVKYVLPLTKARWSSIVEAVWLIADHGKTHSCQLHPNSIEVKQFNILGSFYVMLIPNASITCLSLFSS